MTEERDIRDLALDALLRTHLHDTPPQDVDAAILAAAHRAVGAPPRAHSARATQAWRWWMPLAAAAVIGVVVIGIVPLAPTLIESPPPKSEVSAAPRATPAPTRKPIELPPAASSPTPKTIAAPPAAPQLGAARELTDRRATGSRQAEANTTAAQPSIARSPAAAPAAAAAPASAADESASAATSRPDAALADQRSKQATPTSTADEWIARIRTLRNDGRMVEAAHALTDFRAAFIDADTRLPGDLREWAKTVR